MRLCNMRDREGHRPYVAMRRQGGVDPLKKTDTNRLHIKSDEKFVRGEFPGFLFSLFYGRILGMR